MAGTAWPDGVTVMPEAFCDAKYSSCVNMMPSLGSTPGGNMRSSNATLSYSVRFGSVAPTLWMRMPFIQRVVRFPELVIPHRHVLLHEGRVHDDEVAELQPDGAGCALYRRVVVPLGEPGAGEHSGGGDPPGDDALRRELLHVVLDDVPRNQATHRVTREIHVRRSVDRHLVADELADNQRVALEARRASLIRVLLDLGDVRR